MPRPQMKSQELSRVSQKVDTFAPVTKQTVPQSRAAQTLEVLNDVLPGIATGAANEIGRVVQEDKTLQESRALTNMEPTDDATKAGLQAHKDVDTRNAVSSSMRELAFEATQWEGDGWEEHVLGTQNNLITQYGQSPEDVELIGSLFRDMLPKIADTRFATEQQQDQIAKYRSTINSFDVAVDPNQYSLEEMRSNVTQIFSEAGEMGMTQEATRKAFVDSAVAAAERNELDLIEIAKEIGIYKQEPGLIQAERGSINRLAAEQAGEMAVATKSVYDELLRSPLMSHEEFATKAGDIKTAEGKAVLSRKEINSMWDTAQRKMDQEFQAGDYFVKSLSRLIDETADPVSFAHLTGKEQQEVIALFDQWNDVDTAENIRDAGEDPDAIIQAKADGNNLKARWLAENGLVDSTWKKDFNELLYFDPETVEGESLPDTIGNALSTMEDLAESPYSLERHADKKAVAIGRVFQRNKMQGYNDVQALQLAQKTVNSPRSRPVGDQKKDFDEDVVRSVESQFEYSWNPFSRRQWGSGNDISDVQKATAIQQVTDLATDGYLLHGDVEMAVNDAIASYADSHFQLDSGLVMQGKREEVASRMGVRVDFIDRYLEEFPDKVVEDYENQDSVPNTSFPPEEWIPEITANGLVKYIDPYGATIGTYSLNEISGTSNKALAEKWATEAETLRTRRKSRYDAMSQPSTSGYPATTGYRYITE